MHSKMFKNTAKQKAESRSNIVYVSQDQHKAIKEYSEKTGVPMTKVVYEALQDFLQNVAPPRLEMLRLNLSRNGNTKRKK